MLTGANGMFEMKEKADQKNDDHNQKKQSEREVR